MGPGETVPTEIPPDPNSLNTSVSAGIYIIALIIIYLQPCLLLLTKIKGKPNSSRRIFDLIV